MSDYDCIIVGAGAGGGIVAGVLAEAGQRVLLLERGHQLSDRQVGRDHVRNQRLSRRGVNAGPELEGNPRVSVGLDGAVTVVNPLDGGYENNAACVGGGTRVFGAQAWRFKPEDFRMASIYGVPEGSSLADWPIGYDDLAPYYDRAEWEIGCSGDSTQHVGQGNRLRNYPMPPFASNLSKKILERGAKKLGWNTQPVPLLINTTPRDGRGACVGCSYCVGFACPTDAKNGTHNTMIRRGMATGNCQLITEAIAERIEIDSLGNATGVTYLRKTVAGAIERLSATARTIVVSGGAVESPRLLLNSASEKHPTGIGNQHDQVGRNFDSHYYARADALMPEPVCDGVGPGVTVATTDFTHDNDGIIGGGMLANEFIKLPIMFWYDQMPPGVPRWGIAAKRHMRAYYNRTLRVTGPINNITHPDARVQVDSTVRDEYGIPVPRFSGHTHPETMRTTRFVQERAREWLIASGAESVWTPDVGLYRSGGQHQAGTCRMGDDPVSSVTDRFGRIHGHDNLFVVDASLHVTMGGFNPVLTVMALAFRSAEHILANA